jgi:hypothetical protein
LLISEKTRLARNLLVPGYSLKGEKAFSSSIGGLLSMKIRKMLVAASIGALAISGVPANAVTFVLNDTGGTAVGTQARAGFEAAAYYWSSVFTDDVTITLNTGFKSLGGNILGQTGSGSSVALASDIYGALARDKTSQLDNNAVANLKPLTRVTSGTFAGYDQLGMTVNRTAASGNGYSDRATRFDNDGSANNIALDVNTANMKALGFTGALDNNETYTDPFETPDGAVTFSSDFDFDFDPTDGITAGFSDFIGVAIHEIGHALGFVSGVDTYDYYTNNVTAGSESKQGLLDNYAIGSTLDLFRYSSPGTIDWSTSGTDKYFSVDGGASKFNGNASFAAGVYNGDGDQASHWKAPTASPFCSGLVGIMNPYLCDSTGAIITGDDLAAFDAIGWDVNVDVLANPNYTYTTAQAYNAYAASIAAVPEPATWAMMLLGFGMIGFAARRRSNVKTTVSYA